VISMFRENGRKSNLKPLLLITTLLVCPSASLAQRGAGGIGGGLAGGGGLSGENGMASGLDTKDDLKSFHDALALQASKPQIGQYRLMLKSTEAANSQLQSFVEQAGNQDKVKLSDNAKALLAPIEQARTENAKFLEQLTDRQKSGLRETVRKLNKTDSALAQEIKPLEALIAAARPATLQLAGSAENLKSLLTSFHDQQVELGDEMSIAANGNDAEVAFSIAPVKTDVSFGSQPVVVTTSGVISKVTLPTVQNTFHVEFTADLSDLQQNITEVLRQQLNKTDPCGEQITVQNAALTFSAPASTVLAQLHYERWACFGSRSNANEMAEGNGSIEVTLTSTIAEDGTLRVSPAISRVDAEGLVGDLLRSGTLGETVRDTIAASVLSALSQSLDSKALLPPSVQGYFKLERARFEGRGAGELGIVLDGSMQLPTDKAAALKAGLAGVNSGANTGTSAPAAASPR
jgi:hypothetical protein